MDEQTEKEQLFNQLEGPDKEKAQAAYEEIRRRGWFDASTATSPGTEITRAQAKPKSTNNFKSVLLPVAIVIVLVVIGAVALSVLFDGPNGPAGRDMLWPGEADQAPNTQRVHTNNSGSERQPVETAIDQAEIATVTRIIDGDTIEVEIDGQTYSLRYIGIDTPERGETCADEATAFNTQLVDGQTVTLESDVSNTDRYGRLLRYVYIDSRFINAELVESGYAKAYDYPPDTAHAELFNELEDRAIENRLGCWPTGVWGDVYQNEQTIGADSNCTCSANIYVCYDFETQREAQACYQRCLNEVGSDVHRLDGDNDGRACEALP